MYGKCHTLQFQILFKNPAASFSEVSVIANISILIGVADKNSCKLSNLDPRPFT